MALLAYSFLQMIEARTGPAARVPQRRLRVACIFKRKCLGRLNFRHGLLPARARLTPAGDAR